MSRPPYITIMMLNPIESAFLDRNSKEFRSYDIEEEPLFLEPINNREINDGPNEVVLKGRFSLFIWFVTMVLNTSSCFTFTTADPILQAYYDVSTLLIQLIFIEFPIVVFIMMLLLYKALQKFVDPVILLLVAAFANAIGAGIKCQGIDRTGYLTVVIGQLFIYTSLALSLAYPIAQIRLEKSRGKSLMIIGSLSVAIGCCLGSSLPVFIAADSKSMQQIGWAIYDIFLWNAVASGGILVLIPFALKEKRQSFQSVYQSEAERMPSSLSQTSCESQGTDRADVNELKSFKMLCSLTRKDGCFMKCLCQVSMAYSMFIILLASCSEVYFENPWMMKIVSLVQSFSVFRCVITTLTSIRYSISYPRCIRSTMTLLSLIVTIFCAIHVVKDTAMLQASLVTILFLLTIGLIALSFIDYKPPPTMEITERFVVTIIVIHLLAGFSGLLSIVLLTTFGTYGWTGFLALLQVIFFCLSVYNPR